MAANNLAVKSVFICGNGMVLVFDEHGEQLPKLQGSIFKVMKKIAQRADEKTEFEMQGGKMDVGGSLQRKKYNMILGEKRNG